MFNFRSQKGDIEFLILIVVIIGAFTLAGGQYIFDTLPKGNAKPTPTVIPLPTGGTGGIGGGLNQEVTTPGWSIEIVSSICDSVKKESLVTFALRGTAGGYYSILLRTNGSTPYTYGFIDNELQVSSLNIKNTLGFNTNPWSVKLYEGGSESGGNFTGGTLKVSKNMSATGCS